MKRRKIQGVKNKPTIETEKPVHTTTLALKDAGCTSKEQNLLGPASPAMQQCSEEPAPNNHGRPPCIT
jgi:hypothetical protein